MDPDWIAHTQSYWGRQTTSVPWADASGTQDARTEVARIIGTSIVEEDGV